MNRERKRSIFILIFTAAFGILVGLLLPRLVQKARTDRDRTSLQDRRPHEREHKRQQFVSALYRVVDADSIQKEKIKPVAEWAAARMESVESEAASQMRDILDSMQVSLKPLLDERQQKRLSDFSNRANSKWPGGKGRFGERQRIRDE